MTATRVQTDDAGTLTVTGLPANSSFVLVSAPKGVEIERQPPAGMAEGHVRTVLTFTAVEKEDDAKQDAKRSKLK